MKTKVILTALTIFLVVGGFIKLSIDNASLKREIENLTQPQNEIQTISFTVHEVTGTFETGIQNQHLLLSESEAERLLKEFEFKKKFQISTYPQLSVTSGQDGKFEFNGLNLLVTPVLGADKFTVDLSTSVHLEGQETHSLAEVTIWTGQTVVMASPRNPNSLLFLQVHIQP